MVRIMKLVRFGGVVVGAIAVAVGGILLTTNPNRSDYEQYATREITGYLKKGVCDKAQASLEVQGLARGYCKALVDTGRPLLQEAIASGTTRKNFILFSVYQTELSFPDPVPSYQFSTIAFLEKFFTYEALEI
jgi:Domain of unknown function (DUF4359)